MKEGKQPHILMVKDEVKNVYFQEKYRFCMKGKINNLRRKSTLKNGVINI